MRTRSRGLSEREGAVSAPHVKHLELVKSNATEFRDIKTVHPGYNIVAQAHTHTHTHTQNNSNAFYDLVYWQGPGWSYEGHSGSEWRIKSPVAHPQTATSRPVAPLGALLKRAEPKYCENVLSEGSPGCQIDILKIDCGSCEWDTFRQLWASTDALTLAQVDQVLVELHLSDWQVRRASRLPQPTPPRPSPVASLPSLLCFHGDIDPRLQLAGARAAQGRRVEDDGHPRIWRI